MSVRRARVGTLITFLAAAVVVSVPASARTLAGHSGRTAAASKITQVVIIYQENHSFDNVLGALCVQDHRCNGRTTGVLHDGTVIPLRPADDFVPEVVHDVLSQTTAIDGGKMDGFDLVVGCDVSTNYACYQQFQPSQIPNLAALARTFTISDRTFEDGAVPSWGSHLNLVAAQLDGFRGDNPDHVAAWPSPNGPGWGCDSGKDQYWTPPGGGDMILVPSCVPNVDGSGPYRPSPVQYVPTIMDRLDAAGKSWHIYAPSSTQGSYSWSICPTFAECLYGPQHSQMKTSPKVLTDAAAGTLPNFSIVIPCCHNSQHNSTSMIQGDNWVGSVVNAIMSGPQWSSTAIFIAYDDCGCFYDHVAPPAGLGIRVPVVIVSPYAKPAFTDSTRATFASMLAFTEHTFGLAPLTAEDASAYDYSGSFNFAQRPLRPIRLGHRSVPPAERAWLAKHPENPNDPT
jgi:phospholipase C